MRPHRWPMCLTKASGRVAFSEGQGTTQFPLSMSSRSSSSSTSRQAWSRCGYMRNIYPFLGGAEIEVRPSPLSHGSSTMRAK